MNDDGGSSYMSGEGSHSCAWETESDDSAIGGAMEPTLDTSGLRRELDECLHSDLATAIDEAELVLADAERETGSTAEAEGQPAKPYSAMSTDGPGRGASRVATGVSGGARRGGTWRRRVCLGAPRGDVAWRVCPMARVSRVVALTHARGACVACRGADTRSWRVSPV